MDAYEEKLHVYMEKHGIAAEQLFFSDSCHSVQEAADASGAAADEFVKNICMIGAGGQLIVAIVKGEDRASTTRVGKALNMEPPRTAELAEILEKTGYPCGGVPSFGYQATFLIDPKVLEKETVYTGGGSEHSLVRITSAELLRANGGTAARIRK